MPTYDYKCPKCEKMAEYLRKMCDDTPQSCPECNETMVKFIGRGIGVHFKGSGFYETDYKGK